MRRFVAATLLGSCLVPTTLAFVSPNFFHPERSSPRSPTQHQVPIAMPEPAPSSGSPDTGLIISDVLGRQDSISIFAGLIRDVESVAKRLRTSSANTTVLAPLNSELTKMPRKPWEDPEDYNAFGANAYEGQDGESRAQRNLRRFVEAHLVPSSPWRVGEEVTTLAGTTVTLEEKDGKHLVQPDGVAVGDVADKVSNGQLWILQGVLRRPS